MADDVTLPGTGTAVATDDCSGVQVQLVKLAYSANGVRTPAAVDADGVLVNLGANNDVTVAGVSTAANQTTMIGHLDGVEGLLTSMDADTSALAGCVSGSEAQVDIVAALPAGDNNIGNVDVVTLPSLPAGGNLIGVVQTRGDTLHDAADTSSPPVKIGAKTKAALSTATMVTADDVSDLYADVDGRQVVAPYCPNGDILVERLSDTGGSSTASTVFGATASTRNCITTIAVTNVSATAGFIDFRDGTGGTILFTLPIPAGGGAVISFPVPLRQTTANTAFAYDVSAALTTVYISLIGFKSKA